MTTPLLSLARYPDWSFQAAELSVRFSFHGVLWAWLHANEQQALPSQNLACANEKIDAVKHTATKKSTPSTCKFFIISCGSSFVSSFFSFVKVHHQDRWAPSSEAKQITCAASRRSATPVFSAWTIGSGATVLWTWPERTPAPLRTLYTALKKKKTTHPVFKQMPFYHVMQFLVQCVSLL